MNQTDVAVLEVSMADAYIHLTPEQKKMRGRYRSRRWATGMGVTVAKIIARNLEGMEGRTMLVLKGTNHYVLQEITEDDGSLETLVYKSDGKKRRDLIDGLGGIGRGLGITLKEVEGRADY